MKFAKEITRLRRIEGQARGVICMMEDERSCVDILQQISAIEAALRATRTKVLAIHAQESIAAIIESGDEEAQRMKLAELSDLFGKFNR
ncbi:MULTISPECIES: metal-sensitive transcriptional regulator [Erythrobacteraceae]|jgi:CsoR family transcriptional regulator, copper-sensing transcriptional repressor|uniref:Transcriptional regulator n=2 Tax=Erythrobacteraceae TaxID=335929 RepID=A0A217EYP6_9SPHN|nr:MULTISPECIES: metal-sensitive transcriptional regulator [Erythrobacteraceae]ARU18248.1 transcriptional regulator [Croceicoccus marinus]MDF1835781.1 metal-sensitive transcriptional regulator [Alteraurantiacibacter sp. bin_em_oilr2.035]MDP4540406.1 metal-sensitive transcriptional regulator [Qipengyuania sp. DY56-A-20]QNE06927.1 metal-sensitive transcriptional regulator [Croceicoccus marinus]